MKKIISIAIYLLIISSCHKEDMPKYISVKSHDIFSGENIDNSSISYRWYVGTEEFLGRSTYQIDTLKLIDGNKILNSDLFHGNNCVGDIYLHNEDYHSLWMYDYFCDDFENDTIYYVTKPLVDLELKITFQNERSEFEIKTLDKHRDFGMGKFVNYLIDKKNYTQPLFPPQDTTINISVIQEDTVRILIVRAGAIYKDVDLITNSNDNYYLNIEL